MRGVHQGLAGTAKADPNPNIVYTEEKKMKRDLVSILVLCCFVATSTLTGCATFRAASDTIAEKTGMEKSTSETVTGAALGALGGGLVGQMLGGNTKSTVIGAALGALIGGFVADADAKDRDLRDAELLAINVEAMGIIRQKPEVISTIKEEEIVEKDGTPKKNIVLPPQQKNSTPARPGEIKKVAYFSAFSYPVPYVSLRDKSPTLASTLIRTGEFAISRDTPVQVVVLAHDDVQGKWMVDEIKKGFGKAKNQPKITVKKTTGDQPAVVSVIAENSLKA